MDHLENSQIDYPTFVQDAMLGVVKRALSAVVQNNGDLPGDHHFYITFDTNANGLVIPADLRARFPQDLTIVLQNKFWDLEVFGDHFSVNLTFSGVPARITVPFNAITNFVDPHVDFGLQFQTETISQEAPAPKAESENVVKVDFGKR